ncbi:MAG: YidC/Oxa1 family membrane protein insertase [Patescibacteria group bacterium]|nr:YidC/Oxa1 family membrane protein insertase [Patescibacteria group bacterium]
MRQLFYLILYQPIFNLLVLIYQYTPGHDLGVSIILLTVLFKLVLYPLTAKSLKIQRQMQLIQPQINALQQKYKGQKELLSKELMELYKREKVNPFSSCLPLLIQLPFLIAVYQVFITGLKPGELTGLYAFVQNPGPLNAIAFGFLDLAQPKNWILAGLAGLAQFWQAKMTVTKKPVVHGGGAKDEDMAAAMSKQMLYLMPAMTVFISYSLPTGLALYWLAMTLLTVGQQYLMLRKTAPAVPPAVAVR